MNNRSRHFFLIMALLSVVSCSHMDYKVLDDGVVVDIPQTGMDAPRKVRLTVMSERIIRVTATPDKSFHDRKSLIILPSAGRDADFAVHNLKDEIKLETRSLCAFVDRHDGRVRFTDVGGNPISQESEPVSFTPITVDGTHGYSTINRFNTVPDEGIYGLGQHQSDQWNYKGQNEELYQYNTKISIPFVISSRGYGILWDSYSQGRFGNTQPYSQLNHVFRLYDKDGNEGSLTGTYESMAGRWGGFPGGAIYQPASVTRNEDSIYYVNSEMIKLLPSPLGGHVSYDGYLEPKESGEYRFLLYYAGYVTVMLNGDTVVSERWRTAWNPNSWKFSHEMEAGQRYQLKIDWRPDGSTSYLGLTAYSPVDEAESQKITMWNEMVPESDYYFIWADNMDGVENGLHSLVGKPAMLPKWALGFWQSRERYSTQDELVSTMEEFRRRGIGIDNIVQDWNYWEEDQWGSHEFDKARYPDPQAMVDRVHDLNAHLMISVWPKFYTETEHYKEFADKGWMYMQAVKDSIRDWVGPGYMGSFYDAYAPGARDLFWNQLKEHLYGYGIDAWWMDASEPNIRDCVPMDYWKQLCGPTALGSSTEYLMAYSLMNAQAIYEGLRREEPNKRVFQLTRSGFAGLQRYSTASWSGDIGTRWEDMRSQITAGLNYSLCGNPYWTMDIGGFCTENRYANAVRNSSMMRSRWNVSNPDLDEWRELQARWYQFGAFCPLYRAHGQYPYREVWNIAPAGHPAYNSIVYYNRLRYRLMPYIYSLMGRAWMYGSIMMRGLVLDYPDDMVAADVADQFMLGSSLMVCPVYEYKARERRVYLPINRKWYDFYTDSIYPGGQTILARAPYEQIPLYVPSGGIIISGPDIQYVDEKPDDRLTIDVYAGTNGRFTLYEDDGHSNGYENGEYTRIPILYMEDEGGCSVVIGERNGQYDGMHARRVFRIRLHGPEGITERYVNYSGERIEWRIDNSTETNTISD